MVNTPLRKLPHCLKPQLEGVSRISDCCCYRVDVEVNVEVSVEVELSVEVEVSVEVKTACVTFKHVKPRV